MKTEDYSDFLQRLARGEYQGTDQLGTVWRVVQSGSSRWEVYESGSEVFTASSLAEGKVYVGGEVRERLDPEYAARQQTIRNRRRGLTAAE